MRLIGVMHKLLDSFYVIDICVNDLTRGIL